MAKVSLRLNPSLVPTPVVLASVSDGLGRTDVVTLAWAGVVCSSPPMIGISIRPSRYSYELIKANGEFVVNIPNERLLWATDRCGTVSGRDVDKFKAFGLTPIAAEKVKAPVIAECPVALECVVRHVIPLGSHDLFVGEVVAVHADGEVVDDRGRISARLVLPLAYCQGEYWGLREKLADHHYSMKG